MSGMFKQQLYESVFLTCTGVIIDAEESGVADAHEGAGGVHTLCVLTAVVPPLRTLIDICTENIPSAQRRYMLRTESAEACCGLESFTTGGVDIYSTGLL